jgi:hypothetical protein
MTRARVTGGGPDGVPGTGAAVPNAALPLHLWRRLDWRFLLPGLTPAGVTVAGDADEELLAALSLLSSQVHRITDPGDWDAVAGTCSVAVLVAPGREAVRAAAASLVPGGWVYAEVRRDLRRSSGPRTLLGWRRAFRRAGLDQVAAYWHAPDFATCSRIVSVGAGAAVRETLGRHQDIRFGRLLSLAGRIALRLGLFPLAVRDGSVVGRRSTRPGRQP